MSWRMIGFGGEIVCGSCPPGYPKIPKDQDPPYLFLDSSRLSDKLAWKPRDATDESLRLIVSTKSRVKA